MGPPLGLNPIQVFDVCSSWMFYQLYSIDQAKILTIPPRWLKVDPLSQNALNMRKNYQKNENMYNTKQASLPVGPKHTFCVIDLEGLVNNQCLCHLIEI